MYKNHEVECTCRTITHNILYSFKGMDFVYYIDGINYL